MWSTLPVEWIAETSGAVVSMGANLLLQSTIVLCVGLLAARAFRRRGAALQSAILRTTLVAVLVCPLASWAIGAVGVDGLMLNLPLVALPAENLHVNDVAADSASFAPPGFARATPGAAWSYGRATAIDGADRESTAAASTANQTAAPLPSGPAAPAPKTAEPITLVYAGLTLAWAFGALFLLSRLAICHVRLTRFRRRAVAANDAATDACRTATEALGVRPPPVLVSADVTSPCLIGLVRPAILLPHDADEDRAALRQVMLHELAHLTRQDCLWNLLGRIATAGLFYQPLLWHLARRIELTSDEVCDDHVVRHAPDRRSYARQLIDLAEQVVHGAPETTAGVGMISFKSALGRRVKRILDQTRSLSLYAGRRAAFAVMLAGVTFAMLSALVVIDGSDAAERDTVNAGTDTGALVEVAADRSHSDTTTDVPRVPVATRLDVPADAIMDRPAFSPDGRKIAHTTNRKHTALSVYDRDTKENTVLVPKSDRFSVRTPVWSPDGQRVACVRLGRGDDDPWTVVITPAGGGRRQVIFSSKHLFPWLFDWSQDGKWILASLDHPDHTYILVLLPVAGGEPEQLVSVGWDGITGSLSPDGQLIAYTRGARGRYDASSQLFLLDRVDGSRIAVAEANPRGVRWSPDGQWLVYASRRGDGNGTALWALRVKDRRPVGQPVRIVTDLKDLSTVDRIIRDGTLIYRTWSGEESAVYRVQVDPRSGRPVDRPVKVAGARWGIPSPGDSRRIALRGRLGLKTVAWDGTDERGIATSVRTPNLYGWFPDGKHLLTGGWNDSQKRGLFRVDLETGEAQAIFTRRAYIHNGRLSPDGKRIVFAMPHETQDPYGGSIYTVPAEPGATPVLLRHEPKERSRGPSWSPDGRLVAFVGINQKEKIGRVFVAPVDGGEPKEVARHTLEEGGSIEFTAWSPSGTHILYSLQREAWRVSAQGGEPEHLVELDEFNPTRFIFTADGKTLLFTGTQGGSNPRAWALKNFLPEAADDASGQ